MILQALDRCYEIMEKDGSIHLAPPGYSSRDCSFAVWFDPDGVCQEIIDLREEKRGETHLVPFQASRSGKNPPPYFLCENSKYLLGAMYDKATDSLTDCRNTMEETYKLHRDILQDMDDAAAKAILRFFERRLAEEELAPGKVDKSHDIYKSGFILLKLTGMKGYISDLAAIKQAWEKYAHAQGGNAATIAGQCLVTGEWDVPIARTHTLLKGIMGGQPMGGSLVSFNFKAAESYGKEQSYNAPVSEKAMFRYTTALNQLLSRKENRVVLGDTTCVFWTEHEVKCPVIANMLTKTLYGGEEQPAEIILDKTNTAATKAVLLRALYGNEVSPDMLEREQDTTVYILGLAPNAARLSLRFWYQDTFGNLADHLVQHCCDMEIVKSDKIKRFASMNDIIRSTAVAGKMENAPKTMLTGLFDAITKGMAYPQGIYANILLRIRAEAGEDFAISYARCAFIKAFLKRNLKEEVTVGLNESSTSTGYNLGRLFAVLERVQELAGNKNLRERYFASASTNPITVFPNVARLSQSHITKIGKDKPGLAVYFDKICEDILNKIDAFPVNLNMEEQGMFVLGYYHQKHQKKADSAE